jgi:hypothetical protein
MYPFPSINQFRHVVGQVRRKASFIGLNEAGEPVFNAAAKNPTLSFVGTVKLHGTNAAVVFAPEGIKYQSRERVLTREADNAGFMAHMEQHLDAVAELGKTLADTYNLVGMDHVVAVYGEWCGGNIQKGVAIAGLPKMFVVFAIKVNDVWQTVPNHITNTAASIFSIGNFPKWALDIDFERPEEAQNQLAELTTKVEEECPVGKHFGQVGIGEGIVWRCVEDPSSDLWFKVKGEKHSASKVKTLAPVDTEVVGQLRDFVAMTVTEARLEQGLNNLIREQMKPFDMTSMGDFIRWIHGDVMKEEADTLQASGIDAKKLGGPLAQAAKRWYVERLNQETFGATA